MIKGIAYLSFAVLALLFSRSSLADEAEYNSYGLYNAREQRFELEKETQDVRSIASITKLFTAYTVLNSGVNLYEPIKVNGRSSGRFANGARVERYELLRAMLMSSDNRSAESLARAHPGGYEQFLIDANMHVEKMGLVNTKIADSTGLLSANVSTVRELTEFLLTLNKYPLIKFLSSTQQYLVEYTPPKRKKPVKIQLRNTNQWVFKHNEIVLTKTGWTTAAGRCLAMLVEKDGVLYTMVTLGNKNIKQRAKIIGDMFDNYIDLASK